MERLVPRDRNLVTQIVYGTLRWTGWLDYVISRVCSRPWSSVDLRLKVILRMSLYQMAKMDRIPNHAILHDAVNLAKGMAGSEGGGFVNAILRQLTRTYPWEAGDFDRQCPPWINVSLPRWIWERWKKRFGAKRARDFALSLNDSPQGALRVPGGDKSKLPVTQFDRIRSSEIVPGAHLYEGAPARMPPSAGQFWIQDEASQLVPHLFGSISGWRIWDACAAPGGKSSILSDICGISGILICSDLRLNRAKRLRANLQAAGAQERSILVMDAARPPPFRTEFDAVLADVPCSGLGTVRRNPEIKWRVTSEELIAHQECQIGILEAISGSVRVGGLLLYSTCSTEPEENEQVIDRYLRSHPDFSLKYPSHPHGVERWLDGRGMFRSFPSTRKWDGLFAALMLRNP
jgi:16S rRNA (cytosine967-C5)-methyltransferase